MVTNIIAIIINIGWMMYSVYFLYKCFVFLKKAQFLNVFKLAARTVIAAFFITGIISQFVK